MSDTSLYKLKIAKLAYRDIKAAIEKFESYELLINVCCHWDGCITVDDELFHEHQLKDRNE